MSSKAIKVMQHIFTACAILCAVVGFCYVVFTVGQKIVNKALAIFDDDDDEFFLDEDAKPTEPVIVEIDDEESEAEDTCC